MRRRIEQTSSRLQTTDSLRLPTADCRLSTVDLLEAPQIIKPLLKAAGVRLLGAGERLEPLRDLRKVFLPGGASKAGIHLRVLVGLPFDGGLQVGVGCPHRETRHRVSRFLQEIQMPERVPRLGLGRVAEEAADLAVPLDVGAAREAEIAPV